MNLTNSILIELPVGNTSVVQFGDQSILRGRRILTILPTPSTTPGGNQVYSIAGEQLVDLLAGATITLKTSANHDIHSQLPLRYLFQGAAAGNPLPLGTSAVIDWTKSFITVPPNSAGDGTVIQLSVIYE